MSRRDRIPMLMLVGVLGLGLLAAAYAIWTLEANVRANQTLIRQQQQVVSTLLDRDAENTQALSDQQRLVRGLQAQVLKLGGTPLLQPPSPAATPPASGPSRVATPTAKPTGAAPHPSATPGPTPRPTSSPSHSPTPSPSATPTCLVKIGPVCTPRRHR